MTSTRHDTFPSAPLVVAVSGGVDSVVLLDWLVKHAQVNLIVAHVDHGMRPDSHLDEAYVRQLAASYNLPFYSTTLKLKGRSEQKARQARYAWLDKVANQHKAVITTAHHQDDVLETMLINIGRGTGWRGIASLRSRTERFRPLLAWSKADIIEYANNNHLVWHEDSTNNDLRYRRNYLRHGMVGRLSAIERRQLLTIYESQLRLRRLIDNEVAELINSLRDGSGRLSRSQLIMLPETVALEVLRQFLPLPLTRPQLRRLLWQVKTARAGTTHEVGSGLTAKLTRGHLIV